MPGRLLPPTTAGADSLLLTHQHRLCRTCFLANRPCVANTSRGGGAGPCGPCAREGIICSLPSAARPSVDGPVVCRARIALNSAPLRREAQRRWDFLVKLARLLRQGSSVVPPAAERLLVGFDVEGWCEPTEAEISAAEWAVDQIVLGEQ